MMKPCRMLTILLRLMALAEFSALIGILLPTEWMSAIQSCMGLGDFPSQPMGAYLARHLSALYMLHGGFLWLASTDLRRYSGLIRYLAFSGIAFAIFVSVLDILYGFPWYWMAAEGPGLLVVCAVFLYLLRLAEVPTEK